MVLVLDCCHAGAARGVKVNVKLKATGFELGKEFSKLKNVLTIASCRANQKSYTLDKQKHGLFTYVFAKALHNDDLDGNQDGFIEAAELYVYVRDTVNKAAKAMNKAQKPGEIVFGQRPDVRLCKAIGGTKPFKANFAKEQNGLPPVGWKGQMVVKAGILVPISSETKYHYVALPRQHIRDSFFLQFGVDMVSTNARRGGTKVILANGKDQPWELMVAGGFVYVGGKKVAEGKGRNSNPTQTITLKRIVTKRGASMSVYWNGTLAWAQPFGNAKISQVLLGLQQNRTPTTAIHSVEVGPIRTPE